jgi:hypothetical protein
MKTIDEIIEASKFEYERSDSSGNIDIIREIDEEKLAVCIQGYAEEYAKALLRYIGEESILIDVPKSEGLLDYWINRFKESVKK